MILMLYALGCKSTSTLQPRPGCLAIILRPEAALASAVHAWNSWESWYGK
jgi:hypothetical protein